MLEHHKEMDRLYGYLQFGLKLKKYQKKELKMSIRTRIKGKIRLGNLQ
jgi:hypothetical protein